MLEKNYGLIGYPLSHSFSKKYFDEKFAIENIQMAFFHQFPITNIQLLPTVLATPNLKGFAITIPYKKVIIPYLHWASDAVNKMGACNCVKIKDGKLLGFNTDIIGFEKSFQPLLQPNHKKALILGTGGAAAAVAFVLQKLAIPFKYVSRKPAANQFAYEELTAAVFNEYPIIINTTPLGTYPDVNTKPSIPYHLLNTNNYLYDLVYNPSVTAFLQEGINKGCTTKNGYDMLILQAEENWKIWNED
ncbi:MAG: shikimate dehydrogenase family protein [Chitinophagaceae bacterium]